VSSFKAASACLPACIELAFPHRNMGSFGFDSGGDEKVEAEREFIFSFPN
jgi:hypothetical protein